MDRTTCTALALALLAALLLGACGGGGGSGSSGSDNGGANGGTGRQTITLASVAALDGWVDSSGSFNATGGGPATGDLGTGGGAIRQVFAFPLTSIPDGASIVDATLRLAQTNTIQGTPYASLGNVIVKAIFLGTELDPADFDSLPFTGITRVLSQDTAQVYKEADVTALVSARKSQGGDRIDFRLEFDGMDNNGDAIVDTTRFEDASNLGGSGEPPQLVVEYSN